MKSFIYSTLLTLFFLPAYPQTLDWAHAIGGDRHEVVTEIEITQQGKLIIAGSFSNTTDLDPGSGVATFTANGTSDAFFAAFDTAGLFLWAKQLASSDWVNIHQIRLDKDDNIWISGGFQGTADFDPGVGVVDLSSSPSNWPEMFLAKYNSQGDLLWVQLIEFFGAFFLNGTTAWIETDGLGNAFLAGNYAGTVCFDSLGTPICFDNPSSFRGTYLAKFDANGVFQWGFPLLPDTTPTTWINKLNNICSDKNGNVFLAAVIGEAANLNPLGSDTAYLQTDAYTAFVAKYSANGELDWYRQSNDFNQNEVSISDVKAGAGGDLYVTGYFYTDTLIWEPDSLDGTFSSSITNIATNMANCFLFKLSPEGAWKWGFDIGNQIFGWSLDLDHSEQVLLAGTYGNTYEVDLAPGPDTASLPEPTSYGAIFLASYDSSGHFLWAGRLEDKSYSGSELLFEHAYGHQNELYLVGFVPDTLYMDLAGPQNTFISAAGEGDGYIARYNACLDIINPLDSVQICEGDSILLSGQWLSDSGKYDLASPGLFTCMVIDQVVLTYLERASPEISLEGDSLHISGVWITYQWYKNGEVLPADTNFILIPNASGDYQASVVDSNGCKVFTPAFSFWATSLEHEMSLTARFCEPFSVYPNPSSQELFVQFPAGQGHWTVFDQLSRKIGTGSLRSSKPHSIDLSWLDTGIYVVIWQTEWGTCSQRISRY